MPGADSFLKPFSSQLLQMEDNSGRWKLVPELVAPGAIPSCSSRAALPSSRVPGLGPGPAFLTT